MADPQKIIEQSDIGEKGPGFLINHSDPAGVPRPDVWRQAVADFYQLDLDASALWTPIGPAPLIVNANSDLLHMGIGPDAGEVTDILIDPSGVADQTIYISSDDGGVWKTGDAGNTWTPLTDQMFSLSMGAIAMDPANNKILYAGSGNLFDGGAVFTKSAGIYRSADAGSTWSIVDGGYFGTIFANIGINRMVCPAPDTLLVATNQGLYRSVDGGRNFGANPPNFNDRQPVVPGIISCLILDSATPASTVYCGVAGHSVDPSGNPLPNLGLLKSTNAGITFPTNLFADPTAPQLPYRRFLVAQSQFDGATPNSTVLYVSVQSNLATGVPTYIGLFRSNNSGSTWTPLPSLFNIASKNVPSDAIGDGFTQTNYDLTLGVDPLNSLRVYAGFQQLWLSVDGGVNFQPQAVTASQVHWDNHVIAFSPSTHRPAAAPTTLYTGTDGGIAASNNGGGAWNSINGNLATNLFRGIDIGKGGTGTPPPNAYTYGGCQDTGTSGHRPTDVALQWHSGINGDGWLVAVDPSDPTTVYGFDDQFFIKSSDSGATWLSTFPPSLPPGTIFGKNLTNQPPAAQRAIALEQTGVDATHRTVYVGEGNFLYKSIDSGQIFVVTPLAPGGFVTCITTTALAAATVWAGASDGSVHLSLDGGNSWDAAPFVTTPSGAGLPMQPVNSIAVDPSDPNRVAVVYGGVSGIHAKYRTRHVFLSQDSGATWFDISGTDGNGPVGNVPDLPAYSVVFEKSTTPPAAIIIANDAGVLRCTDATITGTGDAATVSATWKIYGAALPIVYCTSLAIDNSVTPPLLRVATYGRSCFEASHPTGGPVFASDNNLAFGTVAVGQSVTLPFYAYNCGDAGLDITSASILGTGPFTITSTPVAPLTIAPGATQVFQVTFSPTDPGDVFVFIDLATSDPAHANPLLAASGTGVNTALVQRLATNPIASLGFGTVSIGFNRAIPVQLFNVGTAPLTISNIALSAAPANPACTSADFSLVPAPTFPIVIPPGGESDVTFQFAPAGAGALCAEFTITSDDPIPTRTLLATGTGILPSAGFWATLLQNLGLGHP